MEQICRVMTFNIRRSEADDGANGWDIRAPHVVEWLLEQQPHIIGFQELMPDAAELLAERLPGYEWAGCGRGETLGDEHCRIAWRSEDFAVIRQETFWLSDTPFLPGSLFAAGKAVWPRVCTMAELYSRSEKRRFRVYNTHLSFECEYSKQAGIDLIMNRISQLYEIDPLPFLLMGDFNSVPDSDVVQRVYRMSPAPLFDFSSPQGLPAEYTYHGYGLQNPCKIDYLLGTGDWTLEGKQLGVWNHNGVYLSDHYPICAELTL